MFGANMKKKTSYIHLLICSIAANIKELIPSVSQSFQFQNFCIYTTHTHTHTNKYWWYK